VRRRLFQENTENHPARDLVIKRFSEMYRSHSGTFPSECAEADYRRRMEGAYPIHPELFDRLYNDWSSLEKFQRTRGVLRLMAAVIHSLWEREDKNLLIMPSTIPMENEVVQFELKRYLDDPWDAVIGKDVDGPTSLPLRLDRDNPNLGRYSACRRVARTIYMGSAPTVGAANPGIEERNVLLGCVQPGETPATFGDSIRRLTDAATFLYVDGKRYWYSTQPSVTRLAQDRAEQYDIYEVWAEMERRLRAEKGKGEFAGVHVAPETSKDVPDEMETRLVVLGPEHAHAARMLDSGAYAASKEILARRGQNPRLYKNTVIFLAPDRQRLKDLEARVRQFLAWTSIKEEAETLNVTPQVARQAETKRREAEMAVAAQVGETWAWCLVPEQPNPLGETEWNEVRLAGGEGLAVRASKKLVNEELLLPVFGPARLRMELDRTLWRDRDHIGIKELWGYLCSYLYLPRLRDRDVLLRSIQEGIGTVVVSESFAYAEGYDEDTGCYVGLKMGGGGSVLMDSSSLLVKPDAARSQPPECLQTPPPPPPPNGNGGRPPQTLPKRFYASATLDPDRVGRDAGKIADEILSHLSTLPDARLKVSLEIEAEMPEGAPENVQRTISENAQVLKFDTQGFEPE
jgi:hypothetical protein